MQITITIESVALDKIFSAAFSRAADLYERKDSPEARAESIRLENILTKFAHEVMTQVPGTVPYEEIANIEDTHAEAAAANDPGTYDFGEKSTS